MLKSREAQSSAADESLEAVRRRARYRLVGALVLVVLGVIAFPLLFDTQPRPVEQDLAIVIPDRKSVAPLTSGAGDQASASATRSPAPTSVAKSQEIASPPVAAPKPVVKESAQESQVKPETKPEIKPEPSPAPAAQARAEPKPAAAAAPAAKDDAARARAILEGRAPDFQDGGKWVVQIGSYGDEASIKRVRRMLEASGLRAFTQTVKTDQGELTRVRLGPYASSDAAAAALSKAQALGFGAAKVLKL